MLFYVTRHGSESLLAFIASVSRVEWMRSSERRSRPSGLYGGLAVCAALDPMPNHELAAIIERACEMLDRYLDIIPEDGGCDEGPGYWNMAGGSLMDFLEFLEKLTGGDSLKANIQLVYNNARLGAAIAAEL